MFPVLNEKGFNSLLRTPETRPLFIAENTPINFQLSCLDFTMVIIQLFCKTVEERDFISDVAEQGKCAYPSFDAFFAACLKAHQKNPQPFVMDRLMLFRESELSRVWAERTFLDNRAVGVKGLHMVERKAVAVALLMCATEQRGDFNLIGMPRHYFSEAEQPILFALPCVRDFFDRGGAVILLEANASLFSQLTEWLKSFTIKR